MVSYRRPHPQQLRIYCHLFWDARTFGPHKEIPMSTIDQNGRITRRGFFETSARAVAGAGLLTMGSSIKAPNVRALEAENVSAGPTPGKIALEEHFVIPETLGESYGALGSPE